MSFYSVDINPLMRSRHVDLTGRIDISSSVGNIAQVLAEWGLLPPVGYVSSYAGSTAPVGFLLCDGSAVSRADYDALFNVIGETYGPGDGSTTFNVPNLKGRVVVCEDGADTDFDTLGETGGSKTHTLTIPEMPSHNHNGLTQSAGTHTHAITDPGHIHTITDPGHSHSGVPNQSSTALNGASNNTGNGANTGTSTTGITINNNTTGITNQNAGAHQHIIDSQGGDQPHNNLQPYIVLNYLIKY